MQKFLRLALTPLLIFLFLYISFIAYMPPSFHAKAETSAPKSGDYACVQTADVFFYATPNEQDGLFLLPATYYVRLLDYTPNYCRVEYQTDGAQTKRLVGYVKTNQLTFVPYVPRQPYLQCVFEIEYKLNDTAQTADGFLTQIKMSCVYYGEYKVGSNTYCYVLREGEFGYVPKPYDLFIQENTEYAEYLEAQTSVVPDDSEEEPQAKSNSPAQIAILIALCLLVPILAALILKPKSGLDPD
jgi:hypothetical protein